jgi:GTP-binding protein of the ras superfamily involved in termination of M-phase
VRDNLLTQQYQIFKIVLSKAFDLRCTIPEIENVGEPLLLYQSVG